MSPDHNPTATQPPLALYRQRAACYELELLPFEPLRLQALARLAPQAGETVLDLGCGTGMSLPALCEAVGPQGRVVGIEACPDMIAQARRRQARTQWPQLSLIESPVELARIEQRADAALCFFTHDILQNEAALQRLHGWLKPGGRVVAVGLCWAAPWLPLSNAFVLGAALYSIASARGLDQPWAALSRRLQMEHLERHWMDAIYLFQGRR